MNRSSIRKFLKKTAAEISLIIITYSPPGFVKEYRRVGCVAWGFFWTWILPFRWSTYIFLSSVCPTYAHPKRWWVDHLFTYRAQPLASCMKRESTPSGYEVTFQMNLLMHLDSLRFWHDIAWKVYVCINWGEPNTYWIHRKSTSIGTNVPHWNEIWLRPSGKSWRETHTGNKKNR